MQEKTDKELYKEFLLGNNKSFEEIVKRHKNSIIYFIQRYTKSIDIAEDLAQDVFLYVLIHKKNYRFEYSLKTYLYTIAKSKALNYIKREKRIVAIDEKEYENIKDVEELEEKVFKNERTENLKNAIQKLKLEYQNVIYLADIEELSYKEIGHVLNKTTSNVKITVGGTNTTNFTLGTATTSSDSKTKTFPITLNSYTGGEIIITVSAGALKDTAGNSSAVKEYKITPDITKPVWSYQNLTYDPDSMTYSVELVGTDETALNTNVSTLISTGSSKNLLVTCGGTSVTPTLEKTSTTSTKIIYKLTINDYPGGAVAITISEGALIDTSSNRSDHKVINLPEKDRTKPTLKVQNNNYSDDSGQYTFEVVATDETAIDTTRSNLAPNGSSKNITVKCGNTTIVPSITSRNTSDGKSIIYTVTISEYPGGTVSVAIDAGAIYDTTGNKSNSASFTLPAADVQKPQWADSAEFSYDENNSTVSITLTGTDDVGLNDSKSVLNLSTNLVIYNNGAVVSSENIKLGTPTISQDKLTKKFPITLNNFAGGTTSIAISKGALVDNSGKTSDAKTYNFTDMIKPKWYMDGNGSYNTKYYNTRCKRWYRN